MVYEIKCECGDTYIGETSRSISERFSEHMIGLQRKQERSVLYRHMREKHQDAEEKQLKLQILATCPGDAMLRQVTEATYISEMKPSINAKEEWGNTNIPRQRHEDTAMTIDNDVNKTNNC